MLERRWFEQYLDAFNRSDFDGFGAYYADDVQFRGQAASLNGRAAVLDFYRGVKARIDEQIELLSFISANDTIAVEICTTLLPLEDWPDFPTGPLAKGERRRSIIFAFYDVADGKFTRIRSARFQRIE